MTISVIIPTYNRASLVTATLDSVLTQTRPADEVWIVDDGSTDNTEQVLAPYVAAGEGRVRCLHRDNGGLSAARNTGLSASSGEAVLMLDSDDLLLPGALGSLEAALEAAPHAALAYCRSQIVDDKGEIVNDCWEAPTGDYAGDVWEALLQGNFIRSSGAALIRRAALDRVGGWDVSLRLEDWDMWLRLAQRAPFVRVEEPLFQYRVHGVSLSLNDWTMHQRSLDFYAHLWQRYRNDPIRAAALKAVLCNIRNVRPGFILEQACLDLRQGHLVTALTKWLLALWLRPRYFIEIRRFIPGITQVWRALTSRTSEAEKSS